MQSERQTIYADGCYDLFHSGHARQLEQAKKSSTDVKLIVGISPLQEIERNKGRMLLNDQEREQIVGFCKYVDQIILPCPWEPSIEFLDQRGISKIAHDDVPYSADGSEDIYMKFKKRDRFLPTLRTEGISTTDLIVKLISERDKFRTYLLKNNVPRNKLGLSFITEKMLLIKNSLNEIYQDWFGCQNDTKCD